MTKEQTIEKLKTLYTNAVAAMLRADACGDDESSKVMTEYAETLDSAIKALGTALQTDGDCISRQAAIDEAEEWIEAVYCGHDEQRERDAIKHVVNGIKHLPSAQPEPLSDAYMKAIWTWLLNYQIKAAELKGRYTPYEVLSWVANDWRKEHEGLD